MNRTKTLLLIAVVVYLLAWLLPVAVGGAKLTEGSVPGWEAFRLALLPIWTYQGITGDQTFLGMIGVISALTNLLFVSSLVVLAFVRPMPIPGISWALIAATLVNGIWTILAPMGELLIGYYLWIGSFALLALAARRRRREDLVTAGV